MSLDPSKISIISAKKVDEKKLSNSGDTAVTLAPKKYIVDAEESNKSEKRCSLCCALYGGFLNSVCVSVLGATATMVTIHLEKRINYSLNGLMRQMAWISFPGFVVGCSLHFFLSEAMWSGKQNAWGQAWAKAMAINAILWCGGIGLGTLFWQKILPMSTKGRRLFYRYPIPTDPLESRVLRNDKQLISGMGWSYWLSGVITGHLGVLSCVGFCVFNNRPYMLMAPDGKYASNCAPPWRRDYLRTLANTS